MQEKTGRSNEQQPLPETVSMRMLEGSAILDLLPVAVYVCDMSGIILKYNEQAVKLWGRRPALGDQEERYCGSFKLYLPDGTPLPHDQTPVVACLRDGLPRKDLEVIIERPDLSRVHVRVNIVPVYDEDGRQTGIINCFHDITEEKQRFTELTEELEKSEERYHKMIEEVEDYAIILLDKNGIIQNWNKGAEKIKGYREAEIIGKSFQEFYLPEDRQRGLPLKLLGIAREQGKAIHEGWRRRKDGTLFWGGTVLTALHDEQNNVIGFSKVTRDLTDKKLVEDKMQEYLNQLEFRNKELEQFVYAASHDMKEPLRKIHLYNDFIVNHPSNQLDKRSREYLKRSVHAVERMNRLIEDLLAYSRVTAGDEGYEAVDLHNVIREIANQYKEEIEQQKVRLETGPLPVITAIPFQIKQLLFNLVNNAVKYKHPERNAVISIRCEPVNGYDIQEHKAEQSRQYYKISVQDNGIGFDGRYAEKIFDIFQRLNNMSGASGSGIGLAICKRIVQNHRGFITASGKPDEGACFAVYLPQV